jgi:hypothetical protein
MDTPWYASNEPYYATNYPHKIDMGQADDYKWYEYEVLTPKSASDILLLRDGVHWEQFQSVPAPNGRAAVRVANGLMAASGLASLNKHNPFVSVQFKPKERYYSRPLVSVSAHNMAFSEAYRNKPLTVAAAARIFVPKGPIPQKHMLLTRKAAAEYFVLKKNGKARK